MSSDDGVPDRARAPADVGPTDHRLTSGIEADAGGSDEDAGGARSGDSGAVASSDADENETITPQWASSVRNVLAGTIFVLVGVYLAMGQSDPYGGTAQFAVFLGLLVGLYGFIKWPPSGNVS